MVIFFVCTKDLTVGEQLTSSAPDQANNNGQNAISSSSSSSSSSDSGSSSSGNISSFHISFCPLFNINFFGTLN